MTRWLTAFLQPLAWAPLALWVLWALVAPPLPNSVAQVLLARLEPVRSLVSAVQPARVGWALTPPVFL